MDKMFVGFRYVSAAFWVMAVTVSDALARAGGGGGGGGGGFGGGRYVRHSPGDYLVVIPAAILFGGITYYSLWLIKKKKQKNSQKVEAALGELASLDPAWNEGRLKETVKATFFEIQKAWCDQNLPKLKILLAPSLYSKWESDIKFYQKMGQKDFMEDLQLYKTTLVNVENHRDRDHDQFTVCIEAGALDYFVTDKGEFYNNSDPNTPHAQKSDLSFSKFTEYWTYVRHGAKAWQLSLIEQEGEWGEDDEPPVVNEQ